MHPSLVLQLQDGPRAQERIVLPEHGALFGRGSKAQIVIEDTQASREHCEIRPQGEGWVLRDLQSRNGTYLNGQRIQEAFLRNGDQVRVGAVTYRVFLEASPTPTVDPDETKGLSSEEVLPPPLPASQPRPRTATVGTVNMPPRLPAGPVAAPTRRIWPWIVAGVGVFLLGNAAIGLLWFVGQGGGMSYEKRMLSHDSSIRYFQHRLDLAGWAPQDLLCAKARLGHYRDMMTLLSETKADCNARSANGKLPLTEALFGGSNDTAVVLLERYSPKINVRDGDGYTPLHAAAFLGNTEMLDAVIERGAAQEESMENDLFLASALGKSDYVKRLLARTDAEVDRPSACSACKRATALYLAVLNNHCDTTAVLLSAGADANAKTEAGMTPLLCALIPPPVHWTEYYQQHNLNFLQQAKLRQVKEKVVDLLISKGAEPNVQGPEGETPLEAAIWLQDAVIAKRLVDAGANVNVRNDNGETPLHVAAAKGNKPVVELLLQHGAEANAKTNKGMTPLDVLGGLTVWPDDGDALRKEMEALLRRHGARKTIQQAP